MPIANPESVAVKPGPGPSVPAAGFTHRLHAIDTLKGCIVIHLSGYIGSDDVGSFRDLTDPVVEAEFPGETRFPKLILDCAGLHALSGTAIGAFATLQRGLRQRGGDLVLLNLQKPEHEQLRLLGFADLFTVAAGLEEAVSGLSSPGENSPAVLFPHVLECPACTARLRAVKPGRFRCSSCQAVLAINHGAQVFAA